jgi:hypothetical protein
MPASVYTDIVLTLAARRNCFAVANSALMVVLTWLCQLAFTVMVQHVSEDEVKEKIPEMEWMNEDPLSDWNQVGTNGTKWRVFACAGEDLSFMESKVDDMKKYSTPLIDGYALTYGELFGTLAMFLFAASCFKEFLSIVNQLMLLKLKTNSNFKSKDLRWSGSHEGQLASLHNSCRLVVVVTAIGRLIICGYLLVVGIRFLSHTEALKDFILNSVALVFIFEIDDLIFEVFLPVYKKRQVERIAPVFVDVSSDRYLGFISNHTELITLVGVPVVLSATTALHFLPFAGQYAYGLRQLCP